jgi:threonine dehydrogenase-like Zn-dependent dehydrogenase
MMPADGGTMTGLWLEAGDLTVRGDIPRPHCEGCEALVQVVQAGICNTDLEMVRGYYPFVGVPGHEFVGIVLEGPLALCGRRVVGEINAACGSCTMCTSLRPGHCPHRTVLGIVGRHGAFSQFLLLPAENLHPVPDAITDDAATFVEPLAAALQILQQVHVAPASRVLVVGDGKLGLLIAQVLSLTGAHVDVVGRHPQRLQTLGGAGLHGLGAGEAPARSYELAVECTGNPDGFSDAVGALVPGGTLVLKSTYAGHLQLNAAALVVDEITLIGSRCGPFMPALRLLEQNLVATGPLISARYPLEQGLLAMQHAQRPGMLKVMIEMRK